MLGRDAIFSTLEKLLAIVKADEADVMAWSGDSALTRFANNTIHQNVAEVNVELVLRVVTGKRIGIATTNRFDEESLHVLAERALEIARRQPPKEEFQSLPQAGPIPEVDSYRPDTAQATAAYRAEAVGEAVARARRAGTVAAGALSTDVSELAVANSHGIRAYQASTLAELRMVTMADQASGYADHYALGLDGFDAGQVADRAIEKCLSSQGAAELPPGEYTVIMGEPAVAVLLLYLAYMGLDALSLQEERSFLAGRMGSRLVGENITLWDDGLDARGLPQGFDFEGVAKRPVYFFRRGIAEEVVYDSFTANRVGKRSTGHALPPGSTFGPIPMNIFLATGDSSVEEMIASTERGILVSTLHYVNILEPKRTLLTGMTRHGTFLIENGQIVRPVKNLRFTQSALEALNKVSAIGRSAKIQHESLTLTVPALRIEGFSFTGTTK